MTKHIRHKPGLTLLVILATLLSVTVSTGLAYDFFVNPAPDVGHYNTIGEALIGVDAGNRIIVAPGTYNETGLNFAGKDLVLQSEEGPQSTIIDCQNAGQAFSFSGGESENARLHGFTIRNCENFRGGAIYIAGSSPRISNIVFEHNRSTYGGALFISNSNSSIEQCVFTNNSILFETIYNTPEGGAIYLYNYSGRISDSLFSGNEASPAPSRFSYGGAIAVIGTSYAEIINSTFVNNWATNGGVIFNHLINGTTSITNSIFWDNSASQGNISYSRGGRLDIGYSDIEGLFSEIVEYGGTTTDLGNNINADPLFAATDDFHLTASSPCVNTGNNSTISSPQARDLDEMLRIDVGGQAGHQVDMGAFEYREYETFTLAGLGVFTIQAAIEDNRVGSGDTVTVPEGTFTGPGNTTLSTEGKDITLRSASGPKETIIDFEGTPGVPGLIIWNGENNNTIIEGFTFRNGAGVPPVHIYNSSPTFRNCIFEQNNAPSGGAIRILNTDSSSLRTTPQIINSTFSNNNGMEYGGAIHVSGEVPLELVIDDCIFRDNLAEYGGAVSVAHGSYPTLLISRSIFSNNRANTDGGALFLYSVPHFLAENSLFLENEALSGGAIFLKSDVILSPNAFLNFCTITGNKATAYGGGINFFSFNDPFWRYNVHIHNSIIWGNSTDQENGGDQLIGTALIFTLKHVDLEGGIEAAGWGSIAAFYVAGNVIDIDPEFAFTDALHLMPESPCIDAGYDTGPSGPAMPVTDLEGVNDRIINGTPDLGAFEYAGGTSITASPGNIAFTYREEETPPDLQYLSIRNSGTGQLQWKIDTSEPWLLVEPGESQEALSEGEIKMVKVYIDPEELLYPDGLLRMPHGVYSASIQIWETIIVDGIVNTVLKQTIPVEFTVGRTLRVAEDGFYTTIQDAIDEARNGDIVLVDGGTYAGDLDFKGKAIVVRSINGPQVTTIDCALMQDHAVHFHLGENRDSVLEGFTIKNAIDSGVLIEAFCSPSIVNCIFSNNTGSNGAGLRIEGGWGAYVANCRFDTNYATEGGGGAYINGSFNSIIDCTFVNNKAANGGGLLIGHPTDVTGFNTVRGCTFDGNVATDDNPGTVNYESGGGLHIRSSVSDLIQACTFISNKAQDMGAGLYAVWSNTIVANSLFVGNGEIDLFDTRPQFGGAIAQHDLNPDDDIYLQIINCTIVNNIASWGGGVALHGDTQVINTILSGNQSTSHPDNVTEQYFFIDGDPDPVDPSNLDYGVKTSLIEGTYRANIALNGVAEFVNPQNDFHLAPGSFGIDQGTDIPWLFSDRRGSYRSIDGDNNSNEKFDVGAYEYSRYFGGTAGDQTAKAFKDLEIKSSMILTGHEYQVEWVDREPFPRGDDRVYQAGQYGVTLALVSDSGRRIDLSTETMQVSQAGYSLPITFGFNHIGTWRLRLELTLDPNQFVESEPISIQHKDVDVYYLGLEISAPDGADPSQKPDVDLEEAVYWSVESNSLYAVAPYTIVITWYEDETHTSSIPMVAHISAPNNPQDHIAESQPVELLPEGTDYDSVDLLYTGSGAILNANTFSAVNEGYSVLLYRDDQAQDSDTKEVFRVIRTSNWNHAEVLGFPRERPAVIGTEIGIQQPELTEHDAECGSGYVFFDKSWHDGSGENTAYDRENRMGPIFAVNKDLTGLDDASGPYGEPDDLVVVWFQQDSTTGACWPYLPVRYTPDWPTTPSRIVIASGEGSGALASQQYGNQEGMLVYNQPDRELSGYNPNEEHAAFFTAQSSASPAVFALRNDINRPDTSEPYVLLKYRDPLTDRWNFKVYEVVPTDATHPFIYRNMVAGQEINPFYPMNQMTFGPCSQSEIMEGDEALVLKDKDDKFFARNGGINGNPTASFGIRYFYRLQSDFFYDRDENEVLDETVGTCIPFLDNNSGIPETITYEIKWPDPVATLFVGETLTKPKTQDGETVGLPNVADQCHVEVLFDQPIEEAAGAPDYNRYSVNLIDPLTEYEAAYPLADPEALLPLGLKPKYDLVTGRYIFTLLPEHLKDRLTYDPVSGEGNPKGKLKLKGVFTEDTGEPFLLLNTLSARDIALIDELYPENGTDFWTAVNALQTLGNEGLIYDPLEGYPERKDAEIKALTAGDANGTGYVTLAFNNHPDCTAPTTLKVIKVGCGLYRGDIKVLESDNPFAEKVTLHHNGDFGGNADDRSFEWQYRTADFSGIPEGPDNDPPGTWRSYIPQPEAGITFDDPAYFGAVNTVIQGTGQQLLPDKWFAVRYNYDNPEPVPDVCTETTSAWTKPQLYEGWIKRVMKKINLYDQVITNFHASDVDTMASMIAQAGAPYTGDIALSDDPEYLQGLGMIEVYETLLNRGLSLIGEDNNYTDINKALLFAANRLADLYMLLGNEAYGDAADPTIGFSTEDGQYGFEASSIFCFQNQMDSLLDEELALLHGLDLTDVQPFYNRLIWNFTLGDGEVAYKESYNISDQDQDGDADEHDAMIQYPHGHGDAWGHYLSAVKKYYGLLTSTNFSWQPQSEAILVAGTPVSVDYRDERKFAVAAGAKARTGAEIVNLTHRKYYSEEPEEQWQGYKDTKIENPPLLARAWGLDGWSKRAGLGAYYDWVVGNAILPAEDTVNEGIAKVDRTTVVELRDIASRFLEIQSEVDKADAGLNPLGIAKGEVPFDIDPGRMANGESHFEQIYGRSAEAMNNAIAVFNHANRNTSLLRHQQDSLADFKRNIENSEADFNNRLIELFGYPYAEDCGPGKTYSTDYCQTGPDLYHYMYSDPSFFMGETSPKVYEFTVTMQDVDIDEQGALVQTEKEVLFHIDTDSRFGLIRPKGWSRRKAPGELQVARSNLLQSKGRFEKVLDEYDNLLNHIEQQARLIYEQYAVNSQEIILLYAALDKQENLNSMIKRARDRQLEYRTDARTMGLIGNALAEALPTSVGWSFDPTSAVRSAILLEYQIFGEMFSQQADDVSLNELDHQQAKEIVTLQSSIDLTALRSSFAIKQQLLQLENLIRSEATLRLEIYNLIESLRQSASQYLSSLARGQRLLADRLRFRRQTAAQIADYRYTDMSFRIFRNDALQKYRAQFDMAAKYVYLAAKAYDYETTLLDSDNRAGQFFLTDIVKQRSIGLIENGQPLAGSGLADPMRRMYQNFQVLKPQLGINNPQIETNRFSLRQELFRIRMDSSSNETWRQALTSYRKSDLWDVPEFRRYCRPFAAEGIPQPGLVIPFSTTVTPGLNFFKWPLGGGDSYYSSTHFATKISSVGVWFSNYNTVGLAQTPRIYLVPVGEDVLRTPSSSFQDIRTWQVIDQKLPVPFPIIETELESNLDWIPTVDTVFDEMFEIRQHSDFRAYHDSGYLNQSELQYDSRLIGRSVWNSRWLLIIPGQSLLYDPIEGLETFIDGPEVIGGTGERTGNGILDIKLFFETYGYSGN